MKRKEFLKKGALVFGGVAVGASALSCKEKKVIVNTDDKENEDNVSSSCDPYPSSIKGPFPIKSPSDLVKQNIIGDRVGVPLVIKFIIENINNECKPEPELIIDVWHCDAKGNYSEYSGQQEGDFTSKSFLRGRQITDENGEVSFTTIYPGWYPGRAPHFHLEIFDSRGTSLLVTQTALPENVSTDVYKTQHYVGSFDTSSANDSAFRSNTEVFLPTSISGNVNDGFTVVETIQVKV